MVFCFLSNLSMDISDYIGLLDFWQRTKQKWLTQQPKKYSKSINCCWLFSSSRKSQSILTFKNKKKETKIKKNTFRKQINSANNQYREYFVCKMVTKFNRIHKWLDIKFSEWMWYSQRWCVDDMNFGVSNKNHIR